MDRERFDALARLFATTRSRRGTLGALLGVALLGASPDALAGPGKGKGKGHAKGHAKGHDKGRGKGHGQGKGRGHDRDDERPTNESAPGEDGAGGESDEPTGGSGAPGAGGDGSSSEQSGGRGRNKGKRRGKGKDKDKGKNQRRNRDGKVRTEQLPANCCSTNACTPGPGKNLGKCCFEDANLPGQNFKGANLGSANLSGATLTNANFKGANLGKACLVDANLTGATIDGSTNTGGTIFCRTTMPDGNENNGGCARGTRCCPTCDEDNLCPAGQVCCNGRCRPGNCCINGQATTCAAGETCCPDACLNTETDPENCGACGNACAAGADCIGGECERILSGGPDPSDEIFVDDDLTVRLNGVIIFQENDGIATSVPPIAFLAQENDQLRVVASDALQFCHQLSPLFLHSGAGESTQLSPGVPQTCPGVAVGVFFDETFTIPA